MRWIEWVKKFAFAQIPDMWPCIARYPKLAFIIVHDVSSIYPKWRT